MNIRDIVSTSFAQRGAIALVLAAGLIAGCKMSQSSARTDQQITSDIQAKIQGESALSGQNVQITVANGVATLSGSVTNDASRALAGNDSGTVAGVKTVVNNLVVQPVQAEMVADPHAAPAPASQPAPQKTAAQPRQEEKPAPARPAYEPAPAPQPAPQMAQAPPPAPAAAPLPPKPVVKTVTLPAGTQLPVRITEDLNSKTTQTNDVFHGTLASDIGIQGVIAIPSGSSVIGRVADAKDAAHFAGSALLSLELTQVTARGQKLTLATDPYSQEGKGRGKNTAVKAGGGAALGAIIGGIAGGGKGAAIGGLAGAAAGTGVNAVTKGEQVTIPSESLINFQLQSPVTLTVTIPPPGTQEDQPGDPTLHTH
jgi:BON domain